MLNRHVSSPVTSAKALFHPLAALGPLTDPVLRKPRGRAGRAQGLESGGPGFESWLRPGYLRLMLTHEAAVGMRRGEV